MTTKSKQDKHKMSEIDENIAKLFDIKKRLGKGAYGIVWKALDKRNNETIAVKKIFDAFRDETDAQRTFREIIFLKAFRTHPNVVRLHNVYRASNNLDIYLVFEYMDSDLHNIIKKGSILKDIHKRYVMYQLINAVKYIHSGNVIHRDLKPSNVLIDSKCRCKLADFGLARSVAYRQVRSDAQDMDSDILLEPLLTDYVATRWYRAPEILVASKRYTKGIDMWSLGCILGEMIRGKPLFQGSSTVNQIEKIVSTLPDITEHDIKSVGAGFGSVLLNKTISKEKKITLNELLIDATKDALDLVKSLLVLDPMGRLTAKQALSHPYLEKFRNSIPEKELNFDVLPPFRDDVRLTVPEYRSKLYELLNVTGGEKRHNDVPLKTVASNTKNREHKTNEKSDAKRPAVRNKLNPNSSSSSSVDKRISVTKSSSEWEMHHQQGACSNVSVINRIQTKISPLSKRKQSTNISYDNKAIAEGDNLKTEEIISLEDRQMQRNKSYGHHQHQHQHHQIAREDLDKRSLPNVKRHSITNSDAFNQTLGGSSSSNKRLISSHRLCRSSTTLNTVESVDVKCNPLQQQNKSSVEAVVSTLTAPILSSLRPTKSEIQHPPNQFASHEKPTHATKSICYETRLKKLEEEIERYKNEVKAFCRETFINSKHKNHITVNNKKDTHNSKAAPQRTASTTSTPIKTTYFQLLTKGNHHELNKSDFDLNSGNSGGSDHFIQSFSGRSKETNKHKGHNNIQRTQQQHFQCNADQQHSQKQHSRPLSKFT